VKAGLTPILLLLPAGLLICGLFLYPQISMFETSLGAPQWTLANYEHFFTDSFYLMTLVRSLLLGLIVTVTTLLLGLPMAYWLARLPGRLAPFLLVLCTFPLWVNAVVRSLGWIILMVRGGMLSIALRDIGIGGPTYQLAYTFAGVVIAMTQVNLPFMVLSLYGVIRAIDPELEKAAQNLGAKPLAAVLLTTLPLARQGIFSASLLVFALTISAFATPSLVGGARVQLMSTTIYEQMTELADWPFASAVSFVLLVVVLIISLLYSRITAQPEGMSRQ
jgi:ABC-type spermidine/putrescine transport system permease subunit I